MMECCLAFIALASNLGAAEIAGKVQSVSGDSATIAVEGDLNPNIGDKVEVFFKIAGLDEEIAVASGKVSGVGAEGIRVQIENATGEVAKDQLVRVKSARPQPKTVPPPPAPASEPPLVATPAATPPIAPPQTTTAYRSEVQQMATHVFTFDALPVGPLPEDAFASEGLRFKKGKGEPGVYAAEANMLLPPPHGKVLLLGGERVTAFTIQLDPPVKRFALYRAGAANGASTPTWKMTAYNSRGKVLGTAGEEHKIAPGAAPFGIDAEGIVRVELTTDNRYGSGTWATWNSLPVAGFGFDR